MRVRAVKAPLLGFAIRVGSQLRFRGCKPWIASGTASRNSAGMTTSPTPSFLSSCFSGTQSRLGGILAAYRCTPETHGKEPGSSTLRPAQPVCTHQSRGLICLAVLATCRCVDVAICSPSCPSDAWVSVHVACTLRPQSGQSISDCGRSLSLAFAQVESSASARPFVAFEYYSCCLSDHHHI